MLVCSSCKPTYAKQPGLTFPSSGSQLYKVFLDLDSDRYPMKTYADAFFRVFGSWARHIVNVLQAIQLLLTVSVLILGNGQSISQISLGPSLNATKSMCFVACLIIFMATGMVVGQIRTLKRFGGLANFAIWLNVIILIIWYGHILLYYISNTY
jgi:hypothetical protein